MGRRNQIIILYFLYYASLVKTIWRERKRERQVLQIAENREHCSTTEHNSLLASFSNNYATLLIKIYKYTYPTPDSLGDACESENQNSTKTNLQNFKESLWWMLVSSNTHPALFESLAGQLFMQFKWTSRGFFWLLGAQDQLWQLRPVRKRQVLQNKGKAVVPTGWWPWKRSILHLGAVMGWRELIFFIVANMGLCFGTEREIRITSHHPNCKECPNFCPI